MTKTGEVYFRDEAGALWLAESFVSEAGVVTTQATEIEPAPEIEPEPEQDSWPVLYPAPQGGEPFVTAPSGE